jgi:hypothetical protein
MMDRLRIALTLIREVFTGNYNPLNDSLYPALLDRFGHTVARRVVSALSLLLLFTLVPIYVALLWVFNCGADLVMNVAGGWYHTVKYIVTEGFKADDEDDEVEA